VDVNIKGIKRLAAVLPYKINKDTLSIFHRQQLINISRWCSVLCNEGSSENVFRRLTTGVSCMVFALPPLNRSCSYKLNGYDNR
jgi:hypothetical protein